MVSSGRLDKVVSEIPGASQAAAAAMAESILSHCRGEGPANCVNRCPLGVDARAYVQLAKEGRYQEGLQKVRERLPFPGVLGYLCAHPCEYHCKKIDDDNAVRIRDIKRFLADREEGEPQHLLECAEARPQTIAVVGAGPGGLLAAHDLRRLGYRVTVVDRESVIGGCLVSKLPEWRLPARVRDRDLSVIEALGIEVRLGIELGRDIELEDLRNEFDAVLLMLGFEGGQAFLSAAGRSMRRTIRGTLWVDGSTCETDTDGVFAGGDLVSGPSTVIEAMGMGRRAAESLHRRLSGESAVAENGRGATGSKLLWKLEIDEVERKRRERAPVMLEPCNEAMTEEQVLDDATRCLDCQCGLCVKDCEFLSQYCSSPKELARQVLDGSLDDESLKMAYSCNICSLCSEVCPVDLDTGDMLLDVRRHAVDQGVGPLPVHKPIVGYWKAGVSKLFTLAMPEPGHHRCKRLFFTGCALPAVAPRHSLTIYDELRRHYPGMGVLMYCCGAPGELLGMEEMFEEKMAEIRRITEDLGAEQLVAACPDCAHTLKEALPDIDITTVWNLLAGKWDPPRLRENDTISIHDSCKARHLPDTQSGVRQLLTDAGAIIDDVEYRGEKSRCCGFGGMIYPVDPELSQKVSKRRGDESDEPMITYCAGCRMALRGAGKPSIHILDFLLEEDWQAKTGESPPGGLKRYANRLRTKWAFKRLGPLDSRQT